MKINKKSEIIYDAEEVRQIHSERSQKKQQERDVKRAAAVLKATSWITQRLKKSKNSYIKLKTSSIERKLGIYGWSFSILSHLEKSLREYGYEVRFIRVKEKHWWSRKVCEVNYLVIGYDKGLIDFVFPS